MQKKQLQCYKKTKNNNRQCYLFVDGSKWYRNDFNHLHKHFLNELCTAHMIAKLIVEYTVIEYVYLQYDVS